MNRVMLRFRPIAPKPVADSGAAEDRSNGLVKRTKRKYVRVRGRQSKQQRSVRKIVDGDKSPPPPSEKSGTESESSAEKVTVTLQLLPERSERDNFEICDNSIENNWNNNNNIDQYSGNDVVSCETQGLRSVTETMVIVERVTDTYTDSTGTVGLGFSDKENIKSLEEDTCPAFISDGKNNVVWVNEAYKRMVAADETPPEKGFTLWLVVKDVLPRFCPSFACRVRLIQHKGQGQKWNRIVPCDVWRMEFCAGFAWKLDVNTALGLSLQA